MTASSNSWLLKTQSGQVLVLKGIPQNLAVESSGKYAEKQHCGNELFLCFRLVFISGSIEIFRTREDQRLKKLRRKVS